jgi:hypothetical protein
MDIYELAELMHSKQCNFNHTDACGWYYENSPGYRKGENKWTRGWAHKDYLEKANRLVKKLDMSIEDIAKVMEAL